MYRRVLITEVDASTHRVRGQFPDRQGLLSPWLDVLVRGATGAFKDFGLPAVGEQVAVLLDAKEEAGCVIGALYSAADPVPEGASVTKRGIYFGDGAGIEYDTATKVMSVALPEGGELHLVGNGGKVPIAEKIVAELDAISQALDSHTHQAGALMAPPGAMGGPVTGTTGTASAGYSPGDIASEQVHST